MKRTWLLLALLLPALARAQPSGPKGDIPPPGPRMPANTHGVDMRTQSGPATPNGPRYVPPLPLDPALPNFWVIGDSTVRNGSLGDGTNLNQWGWGAPLTFYFDPRKVNVVNRALGGTSARSFYNGNWKTMVGLIKRGDVVIMQFGTNDGGNPARSQGDLPGIGDETQAVKNRAGQPETLHTFGWYLQRMVDEAKAKGATPIVCALIPRKTWDAAGHIKRTRETFEGWTGQVAARSGIGFIDLNELIAREYDKMTRAQVDAIYVPNPTPEHPEGEHVHTGWDGAVMNAEIVVAALKALPDDPVAGYFSAKGRAIAPAAPVN